MRFQWVCCCLGALAWQDASGRLPAPDSGMGRSPSVSSGPDPAFGIYFLPTVTTFIGVASEVRFYSFFFSFFPPLPLRTPGLFPFLEGALKSWNSLLILTLACNCFACARRIVEGTHPLTPNLNETAGKVASQPPTHPMSAEARGPHIQIRFKKRKMEGEGY